MYEKILAPLDGSDLCELVLPYVEELGARLSSEIILLHVCPPKLGAFSHKHETYIEHMAQLVKEHLKGEGKVEPVLLDGEPNEEIVGYAKRGDISLIAMMTHGRSGVKRWLLGSTIDKVIRETDRPLLIIRAKAAPAVREEGILNRVLVPLDGSKAAEATLPLVEELMREVTAKEAEATLLMVIPPTHYVPASPEIAELPYTEEQIGQLETEAKAYLEKAGSGLKSKGINLRFEVAVGNAAEEIIEFANKVNANLTAMSTHGYSDSTSPTLGSVANRVLHHGSTPLLLVKPAEA